MRSRVCIVSENAYPVLDASDAGSFGGAETRAVTFARGLRDAGCDVVLAVDTDAHFRQKSVEGISIVNMRSLISRVRTSFYRRVGKLEQFPWIRIRQWHPLLLAQFPIMALAFLAKVAWPISTIHALLRIKAQAYIAFGVDKTSGRVVCTAKRANAQSIVSIASNADLDSRYFKGSRYLTPYAQSGAVCHYTIANADMLLLQTEAQKQLLADRFERQGVVVENPFDMQWWAQRLTELSPPTLPAPGFVLWVGRAHRLSKRPHLALEIAHACPEQRFVLIVDKRDPTVEQALAEGAPSNVELRGRTSFSEMPHYFRNAMLFLNTGSRDHEGFPNVFLQAAASEVPIVALEVGAEFLARAGCGICAEGSAQRAVAAIRALADDAAKRREYGLKGKQYVLEHHRVDDKARQVIALFANTSPKHGYNAA